MMGGRRILDYANFSALSFWDVVVMVCMPTLLLLRAARSSWSRWKRASTFAPPDSTGKTLGDVNAGRVVIT